MLFKKFITVPGFFFLLPGIGQLLLLLHLLLVADLLLPGWPWWLFSRSSPGAIHSSSLRVLLCDLISRFLPPPTLWKVSCMILGSEPQNSQRKSFQHLFLHASWSGVCRMPTPTASSHFCCWTWKHALSTGNACSLPTRHNSRHIPSMMVFQPRGSTSKTLCTSHHFFCNWSCSLGSCLAHICHLCTYCRQMGLCSPTSALKSFLQSRWFWWGKFLFHQLSSPLPLPAFSSLVPSPGLGIPQ